MGLGFQSVGRSHGRRARIVTAAGAIVAAFIIALPALAAAPFPAAGSAVVDGDASEWTAADHFAAMKHDGSTKVVGSLSLRYDCESGVLSALVLAADGVSFRADRPENAYVRIDGVGKLVSGESGDDGTPPDFAWVGLDDIAALGYEASGVVAPGEHTIRVHVLMFDDSADGGYLTIDSDPRTGPLTLACDEEEPASSASATPTPTGQVEAATGVPITPPPTDTFGPSSGSWALSGLLLIIAGLAAIDIAAMRAARVRAR